MPSNLLNNRLLMQFVRQQHRIFMQFLAVMIVSSTALLIGNSNPASAQDELLPEDQAFIFKSNLTDPNTIEASWQIADGYYLYRDKIEFEVSSGSLLDYSNKFPQGIVKQDPLFGEVEVYTESFSINLPASFEQANQFTLVAKAQGCNEPVGVCYPPMTRTISYVRDPQNLFTVADSLEQTTLADASLEPLLSIDESANMSVVDSASELRSLLSAGFDQTEFLDVSDAFQLQMAVVDNQSINANFVIAKDYYLYRDKISFSIDGKVLETSLPVGKPKKDEYFGEVQVYVSNFVASVLTDQRDGTLTATYQGCAEQGICYAPVTQTFDIADMTVVPAAASESTMSASFNTEIQTNEPTVQTLENTIAETANGTIKKQNPTQSSTDEHQTLLGLLVSAFFAGILLTFTPCVLPLIPILSSVIAGQGQSITRTRGGLLAVIYVIGTMITYAAMGAIAGATGDQLQAYFQNIWAIGLLCILFFIMALSMFGLFEIQMPGFIQERIQTKTGGLGGSIPMVLLLGLFSALIVGACVSPVLISFLGVAMSSQSPVLGAQVMTAMALGMGVPLIIVGIGAGHIIPRAGPWMEKIKKGFGVLLIGVAIYLLGLLPEIPVLLIWGGFFIILSTFLGATESTEPHTSAWQRLEKGIGIILLVWGILAILGGFTGQRDIFKPIPENLFSGAGSHSGNPAISKTYDFKYIKSIAELDDALASARQQNKMTMIDYYADWCVDCIRMEKTTFSDTLVKASLQANFITLKVDVTDPNDENGKALKRRYNVFGPPATIFVDAKGMVLEQANFYGYKDAETFLALIDSL